MKRIIVTESQFDRLIKLQLTEDTNKDILEEGPKEWLLVGLMTLASMAGLSQTKQSGEFDKNRVEAAELVQKKLERGDDDVYQLFDKTNIELNKENLNKLKSVDVDGAKMDVVKTGSKSMVKSKLKQGYVLSDVKITSDTILKKGDAVYMGDTITLDFSSDAAFRTGTFNLTETYKQDLLNRINEIYKINGKVTKVTVESSTDTEPIRMGNQRLAELRSNSVVDFLNTNGVGNVEVVNLPDQGPSVYTRTMSTQEREQARQQTSQYRYVKITIEYEVEVEVPSEQTVEEIVNKYKFEMVKVTLKQDVGTYKFKGKSVERKPLEQPKCKKVRYNNKMTECPINLSN
jgi:outer membrane protein OmpA-like peptidoglycan-associated protein